MKFDFSKIIAIGSAVTALIPNVIVPAIHGVEAAVGPGNGSAKLEAVLGVVQSAYGALNTVEATWAEIAPTVTGTVNALVAAFNSVKLLTHGGGASPAAPAVAAVAVAK